MAPPSLTNQQTKALGLGLMAAALAGVLLWYAFRSTSSDEAEASRLLKASDDEDGQEKSDDLKKSKKDVPSEPGTPVSSNVTPESVPPIKPLTDTDAAPSINKASDEKVLHQKIEEIDRRGKTLFKSKKYMEAADAFTEALDLISSQPKETVSLSRQTVTLTNNRSAMYEKGGLPDLALHDCDAILAKDPGHTKARTRRLRILESQKRHGEALVEVCALQLRFMQDNRDKLRLGIPVTPPVPQSKIEDLMASIVPGEVDRLLAEKKEGGSDRKELPSDHTILQLLRSFTGYNTWMSRAARDGSIVSLTAEIDSSAEKPTSPASKAKKAGLLLKRGRRHAYDQKFDPATEDFEAAYKILQGDDSDAVLEALEGDEYVRILEWVGMSRHLRYDLEGALGCYEKCSDLEPTNAEILVKRAGVKMDGGKQDEAMTLFETALGLDPDAVDALLHRANLLMLQQKPAEAKNDLEKCLKLRPDHLLARLRLATVLMAMENLDGAKKSLDMAEKLDPNSSEVHSYRGEMHFAQGEFVEARAEFDKAIKCECGNPTPYVNAALAVMNTPPEGGGPPDVAEAIRLLEKAVEVDPQFHAAYVHLGQLKLSMATDLTTARDVIALYDRGLEYCRTSEELKDICSMRILTVAQVDAATLLKMETLNMQ